MIRTRVRPTSAPTRWRDTKIIARSTSTLPSRLRGRCREKRVGVVGEWRGRSVGVVGVSACRRVERWSFGECRRLSAFGPASVVDHGRKYRRVGMLGVSASARSAELIALQTPFDLAPFGYCPGCHLYHSPARTVCYSKTAGIIPFAHRSASIIVSR